MNTAYQLQLAYQRLQAGHNDGAIESLRQLLAEDSEHAEAHALLAICLINMRRVHAARTESRLALAADAQLPVAHYAAAVVAIAQRQFKDAEAHLRQLLDIDPLNPVYHRTLAELYELTGRSAQRLEQLEKALELGPNEASSLVALAQYHRSEGHWEQSEGYARQALNSDPGHVGAVVVLGHLLLRRGETGAAREHAVWALQENPNDRSALHLMTAVKARESMFLSLWWRLNAWLSERGTTRAIVILLSVFVVYRVVVIAVTQQGYGQVAQVIDWVWLAFVFYTFAAPQIFKRALDKELVQVKLSKDF
jgi:tetratricopeptide (TPR) repeat protein